MKTSLRLLALLLLATTLNGHAAEPKASPKRPATPTECDPSNWSTDPNVDYSICDEGARRPAQ